MVLEGLSEYRSIFALASVEEFVEAALTFSCPVKPTAFRLEQVSLLLAAAEDRLLACNAERSIDAEFDFIDEENNDDGSDDLDVEAAALLAAVREQRKRFEVFRKMEGLPYVWSYVRDADEETLGRILVSNERLEALAAFGIVPHHVLDSIPLHDHAETWKPFAQTFRETNEPQRWFANRCAEMMELGLFKQAAEWVAFGQEVCASVNTEGRTSHHALSAGKVSFMDEKEPNVIVFKVLAKLIWEYTTYCLKLWDGAFSLGDHPPCSFDEFCELPQADRLDYVLTNCTKDSIVDDVKAWLRHAIDAPEEKSELHSVGLPEDAVGEMDDILMKVLRQKVVECERSTAAATFSTVASIAIASKPTLAASDRVVRSPLLLMRFILRIVYDADCPAIDILDDVEEMYTCIPDPEAHKAVGATDEEWNELMTKANTLNDHLVTVADVLKPYGFSQALSFQELESQCTATTCRNLFQNLFRTLNASWMSADEWHSAIDRISYIHERTFQLMPKDELFELYVRALVHQDHFDVLDRVLDAWQTIESLRIVVAHVKELANSSPALSHPLIDKARRLLMLAGQKALLPEIDGELRFLQACELLNQLEECKKPGGGLKTAKNFIRNVDPLSLVADGVGGATHTVVEGIVGSASKIRTDGVVGGLRSIAGGVFASDGAIAHLKDGIADRVKNVVHTLVPDTALGPPPFSNPLQLRLKWQASEAVQADVVEQLLQYNINVLDHQKLLQDFLALLPPCSKPSKDISCLLCSAFLLQGRLQDAMIFIDELLAAGHPKAWRFCVSYAWRDDADRDVANGLLAQALKSCDAAALPEVLACLPRVEDDEIPADIMEGSVRTYRFDPDEMYPSTLHRLIERDEVVARALTGRLQQGGASSSRASGLTVNSARVADDPFAGDPFADDPFADDPFADVPFVGGPSVPDPSSANNNRYPSPGKNAPTSSGEKAKTVAMPVEERIESPASKQSSANWSFSSDFSLNEEPIRVDAALYAQDAAFPAQTESEPVRTREISAKLVHAPGRVRSFSSEEPPPSIRSRPSFLEAMPVQIMDMPMSDASLFVERHLPEWIGAREKLSGELVQVLNVTTDSHKALLAREVLCHLAGKGDRVDVLGIGDWTATRALRQCLAECPCVDITGTVIDRDRFFNSCDRRSLPAVCRALSGAQLGGLTASFIAKCGLLRHPRDAGLRSWLTLDDMRALLDEAEGPMYFTFARWWRDTPELADIIQRKREMVVAQETYEHIYGEKPRNRTVSRLLMDAPDERFGQAVSSATPSLTGAASSLQTPRTPGQRTSRGITDQVAKLAERVLAGEVEESCSAAALLMQMPACQRALAPAGNITVLAHLLRRFPSPRSAEALKVLAPSLQRFR